jgi:hypothetical protein
VSGRARLALADAARLDAAARRTTILRLGLALLLGLLLATAVGVAARGESGRPPLAEAGRTTILVVDVSSSIQPRVYRQIGETLGRAMKEGGRFGVVLFSDVAYEMLPPGTPAAELAGLRRYFVPIERRVPGEPTLAVGSTRFAEPPWHQTLTSGTKISTGLRLARELLEREGVENGKVVLVSDLEDEYLDIPDLGNVLAGYADADLPLRVVALSPTPDDRRIFERLLRSRGSVEDAALPSEAARSDAVLPPVPFPRWLLVAGVGLALALAANERLLPRLALREGGPGR